MPEIHVPYVIYHNYNPPAPYELQLNAEQVPSPVCSLLLRPGVDTFTDGEQSLSSAFLKQEAGPDSLGCVLAYMA